MEYDEECCHVQGTCEWVACKDSVSAVLQGGTIGSPVTAVYVGQTDATLAIPTAFIEENTTLVCFQAFNVSNVTVRVDNIAVKHLRVAPLSPQELSLTLEGEFWNLKGNNNLFSVAFRFILTCRGKR